jgi:hypothetical protein
LEDESLRNEVTFMLVCKDKWGNNRTYAIKINPKHLYTLRASIMTEMANPKYNGLSDDDKFIAIDVANEKKYNEDPYKNPERMFLNIFKDYPITLYKLNPNGENSFNKLSLDDPDSSTSKVNESYCGSTDII